MTIYQGKYLSLSSVTYKGTTRMLLPFIPGVILQLHPLIRHFQFNESLLRRTLSFMLCLSLRRFFIYDVFSTFALCF